MLSLGFFLRWIAIALIGIGLLFLGLNMSNPWVCLGAGMTTIVSIMMIISGIFTHDVYSKPHYDNDSDFEEGPRSSPDYSDVTSTTERTSDGYKTTIKGRNYGTDVRPGRTAKQSEDEAHRVYEHYTSDK